MGFDTTNNVHITLSVKTPISGKVILEQNGKELGFMDCYLEEFEKSFEFDIEQDTFGVIFDTGFYEKEFYFYVPFADKKLNIDVSGHLTFDEIRQCCNRTTARRKLQIFPTNIYAIYQLGWVGKEEDLNFLLGILEDDFAGSSLSFGDNGDRVLSIVDAVFNLSSTFKRNDAIPLFRSIAEIAKGEGLARVSELAEQNCISLEDCKSFSSYKYRTDILVRTHLTAQLFLNSQDKWLAEIDGTANYEEKIDWCCVRTNTEKFSLLISTTYGDTVIPMDIKNNNNRSRQVIDIKPPVFSKEMAKSVLDSKRDRILVVPDGIEILAGDFAFLFDERDEKYHFYEIDIPASVTTIESLFLTEDPGDAWATGKDFDCFDEIIVSEANENFCSEDGILFSKDKKRLICYPCGKQGATYAVPNGVDCIGAYAFQCNQYLESVSLPASVKTIDWRAFSFCEKLESIILSEGLEVIDEDAFEFCSIKHLTLPKSLKKIHWSNLSSIGSGVSFVEIPDSDIEIDMSGYAGCNEDAYMPPLFLIKNHNSVFEKYARRHKRNIVNRYYTDDAGIVWTEDGKEIVEFPMHWTSETYHISDSVSGIHRWAFNQSDVKHIIATKEIKIKGNTSGNDFSRLASKDDFRFEQDFLIIEDDLERTFSEMTERGKVIILSGPSAAGKGTIANILVSENENYQHAVTSTTRSRREGETLCGHYSFLTKAEFEKAIHEEQLIEYEQYAGNYYGTLKAPVYSALNQGINVILEVDFKNALQFKRQNPDTLLVYIMPPDAKSAIDRLTIREDNDARVRDRLAVYAKEAYSALRGDILLINDDPYATAHVLASIVNDPKTAEDVYDENVELVVTLKKEIEKYLEPSAGEEQTFPTEKMLEYLKKFEEKITSVERLMTEVKKTGEDTNIKVTSLVNFVENDLQTWIVTHRPGIEDENLIEEFAKKTSEYINTHIQVSNQKVQEEEVHLKNIFGSTWNKLLPTTQSSLISAGVLWKLCADITDVGFDYSGIIIAAASALESELKRVFFTDFQSYMLVHYGNPETQSADTTYGSWPERLLSKTKAAYDNEMANGVASLPKLADDFTMGTLPHMFDHKKRSQKKLLLSRMEEYLKTIVITDYYRNPIEVFNAGNNCFVKQCENIRTEYRNPAGHVDVLPRESAEECYTKVVGGEKVNAFRLTHEIEGLIMRLYSYLQ